MIPTLSRYSPTTPQLALTPTNNKRIANHSPHQRSGVSELERDIFLKRLLNYLWDLENKEIDPRTVRMRFKDLLRKINLQNNILNRYSINTQELGLTAKQKKKFPRWQKALETFKNENPVLSSALWRTTSVEEYKATLTSSLEAVVNTLESINFNTEKFDFSRLIALLNELGNHPRSGQLPTTILDLRKQEYSTLSFVVSSILRQISP
jgi:hypothetical protein